MATANHCDIAPTARVTGGVLNHTKVRGESQILGGSMNGCTVNAGRIVSGVMNHCTVNGGIVQGGVMNHCRVDGGIVRGGILNHCVVLPGAIVPENIGMRNHETFRPEAGGRNGVPRPGPAPPRTAAPRPAAAPPRPAAPRPAPDPFPRTNESQSSVNRTNSSRSQSPRAEASGSRFGDPARNRTRSRRSQSPRAEDYEPVYRDREDVRPSGKKTSFQVPSSNARQTEERDENPPPHLVDHIISFALIHEAVMTPSGHTYDREIIERHIADHGNCPVTREPLDHRDLRPNRVVQQLIDEWKAKSDGTGPPDRDRNGTRIPMAATVEDVPED